MYYHIKTDVVLRRNKNFRRREDPGRLLMINLTAIIAVISCILVILYPGNAKVFQYNGLPPVCNPSFRNARQIFNKRKYIVEKSTIKSFDS
jgi:hypothetical protein